MNICVCGPFGLEDDRPTGAGFGNVLAARASARRRPTLRIGLAEDPDILDPAAGAPLFGRIVFSAFADKCRIDKPHQNRPSSRCIESGRHFNAEQRNQGTRQS